MDGLAGLEKVFKEEFYNSSVQRCQVHLARNVLSKVPIKHKKEVADDLRSIFYASSKDKAMGFFKEFKNKYDNVFPSAVKSLSNSIDSSLTFLNTPADTKAFGFCNSVCLRIRRRLDIVKNDKHNNTQAGAYKSNAFMPAEVA